MTGGGRSKRQSHVPLAASAVEVTTPRPGTHAGSWQLEPAQAETLAAQHTTKHLMLPKVEPCSVCAVRTKPLHTNFL